jgi:hypothetical protein
MQRSLIIILLICSSFTAKSQTVTDVFLTLPEPLFLTLSENNKLDLIDLYKANQKAEVKNLLEDTCTLVKLTDNFLQIENGNSTFELLLLPMVNDSKIVCLIQTLCAPVCDSQLAFYTTNWKKMDANIFFSLADKSRFIKDDTDVEEQTTKNTLISLDVPFMQLHYDVENQVLLQYYNTPQYLSEYDKKKVKSYLKDSPIKFRWNQVKFE